MRIFRFESFAETALAVSAIAPVLELAYRRDLHSRVASRHSGSDPRLGHQLLADRNR